MKEHLPTMETDSDSRGLLGTNATDQGGMRGHMGAVFLAELSHLPRLAATEKAEPADDATMSEIEPADMPGKVAFCAKKFLAEQQAGAERAEWFNVRLGQFVENGPEDWTIDLFVKLPGVGSGPMTAGDAPKGKLWIRITDGKPSVLAVTQF